MPGMSWCDVIMVPVWNPSFFGRGGQWSGVQYTDRAIDESVAVCSRPRHDHSNRCRTLADAHHSRHLDARSLQLMCRTTCIMMMDAVLMMEEVPENQLGLVTTGDGVLLSGQVRTMAWKWSAWWTVLIMRQWNHESCSDAFKRSDMKRLRLRT